MTAVSNIPKKSMDSVGAPPTLPEGLTPVDPSFLRGWRPFIPAVLADELEALASKPRRLREPFSIDEIRSWAKENKPIQSPGLLGWNDGLMIFAGVLNLEPSLLPPKRSRDPDLDSALDQDEWDKLATATAHADQDRDVFYDSMAGMAGFILMQQDFHAEYAAVRTEVAREHSHRGAEALQVPIAHSLGRIKRPEVQELVDAFLRRWRLRAIPAPYVLEVDGPLEGFPASAIANLRPETSVAHYPAGLSVPPRDQAASWLIGAQDRSDAMHPCFSEWDEIVSPSTQDHKTRNRFARLYRVQYYYRMIVDRWPQVEQNSTERVLRMVIGLVSPKSPPLAPSTYNAVRRDVKTICALISQHQPAMPNAPVPDTPPTPIETVEQLLRDCLPGPTVAEVVGERNPPAKVVVLKASATPQGTKGSGQQRSSS